MIADLLIAVLVFASIVGNVGNVITSLRDRDNVFFPNHELVTKTFYLCVCIYTRKHTQLTNSHLTVFGSHSLTGHLTG